jgi:hypothetical protein
MKNASKPTIIIEVSEGKVWWIVADQPVNAIVMDHGEGTIRRLPTDVRNSQYVTDITDIASIADHIQGTALIGELEDKMRLLNPQLYARMKALQKTKRRKKAKERT